MELTVLLTAILVATILGPITHYAFWVRFEFDGIIQNHVPLAALSQPVLVYLLHLTGLSLAKSVTTLCMLQTVYTTSTLASISIYRLFFHPCRQFVGPFWARLSSWWKIYAYTSHNDQAFAEIYDLHQKYGEVVRIGPRHLVFNHVDAVTDIYGTGTKCVRTVQTEIGKQRNLNFLRDWEEHKIRRKMWDQGLSAKVCQDFLPRLSRTGDMFMSNMRNYKGEPVAINDWCRFIAFDLMAEIGFGVSYGQLETGKIHPAISHIASYVKFNMAFNQVPWLANAMSTLPGAPDPVQQLRQVSERRLKERESKKPENRDIMATLLKGQETGATAPFPYSRDDLIDDVFILQIAGSETQFSTMIFLSYYLSLYPDIQSRLREDVTSALPSHDAIPDWKQLSSLEYLDAVVQETLRMWPALAMAFNRETSKGSSTIIAGYPVPAETILTIPIWSLHRNEKYFARPTEWIPERWTSQPELIKDKRAFIPFGHGQPACPGQYFAMMSLKTFVAKLVTAFEVKFAPGEDGSNMLANCKDYVSWQLPDLRLCLVARDAN